MTDDDAGKRALDALYRRSRDESPRQAVDDAVLDAAARAARARRRRWWKPVSAAAVIVLGATVALQVFELTPVEQPVSIDRQVDFEDSVPARLPAPAVAERVSPEAKSEQARDRGPADQAVVPRASLADTSPPMSAAPAAPAVTAVEPAQPRSDRPVPAQQRSADPGERRESVLLGSFGKAQRQRQAEAESDDRTAAEAAAVGGRRLSAVDAAKQIELPSNLVRLRLLLPQRPTVGSLQQALPDARIVARDGGYRVLRETGEAMRIEVAPEDGRLSQAIVLAPSLHWLPGLPFGSSRDAVSPGCTRPVCDVDAGFQYLYRREASTGDWVLDAVRYEPR